MYHSAIKKFKEYTETKSSYFEQDGFYGIVYDLEEQNPPAIVNKADFIYCELPWLKGYSIFNQRAKSESVNDWKYLLLSARKLAIDLGVPYYFAGNKQFSKVFTTEYQVPMKWHIHNCDVIIYTNDPIYVNDSNDLIDALYTRYNKGMDMACGYGYLGKKALEYNKTAILMDINPYCIGYIKDVLLKQQS